MWRDTGNGGHVEQANGNDFLVTDSTGTNKLAHEIEKYTETSGNLIAWVTVPVLSAVTDTDLYVYYGHPSCGDQQNITGVWDTDHIAVWHMDETASPVRDSTSYGHNSVAIGGGVTLNGSGRIDGCDNFNGGFHVLPSWE